MVALYVTSSEKGSGKTAVAAALGKHLLAAGKKIGFLKPLISGKTEEADSDAALIKHLFALEEPIDIIHPAFGDESQLRSRIKEAYTRVSPGKDVVIIEGVSAPSQTARDIVAALDARVIIVQGYSPELPGTMERYQDFGGHLLGVVANKVPRSRREQVRAVMSAALGQAGINLLGVLPEDRALCSLTIGELAERIQGEILNNTEKSGDLVENLMLGAMCVDPGPLYFGHKGNKAAIIRSERSDMQLAALETSTRCLVLTGREMLKPIVRQQAEEKKVPIILAREEITTVATDIEDALGKTRFSPEKLPRLTEIMEQHFDFQTVDKALGLGS